jgi:toxin ParE1/3/4
MKVVFDPDALSEAHEAAHFYEHCRAGLGDIFLDEIELAVAEVARHPFTWRRVQGPFRRSLLLRFPCGLIYSTHEETVP